MEKLQRKIIFLFMGFAVLYFGGFAVFSSNESNVTDLFRSHSKGYSSISVHGKYRATYHCYSKEGIQLTLTALIYPRDGHMAVRDQAAGQIQALADADGISLDKDYENNIEIDLVDR